jgi:hypothetical protein
MRIVLGGGSNFGFSYSLTCLLVLFVISSANAKEVGLVCDVSGLCCDHHATCTYCHP